MKNKLKKLKIPYLKKGYYFVAIFFIFYCTIRANSKLDNDVWFLINHGKYIFKQGIPYIEPFTIHENLKFVMQQWLSSFIFYLFYNFLGLKSIFILVIAINFLIVYVFYKLCMLLSDNNYKISSLVTILFSLLINSYYICSRPQIFTYIIILILLYILEKYIKTGKAKYLFVLPILSILEINLHASMWPMLFVFMLPYLFDGYNIRFLNKDTYSKKYIIVAMIVMFLVGFINPYGIDSITYLFKSYGNQTINSLVTEMHALDVNSYFVNKIFFLVMTIVVLLNIFANNKKIKARYLLLTIGTIYLTLSSIKGFSYFLLASLFPISYYYKDSIKIIKEKEKYNNNYKIRYGLITLISFIFFSYIFLNYDYTSNLKEGIDLLLSKYNKNDIKLFVGYNDGGYTEFRGIKSYLDPRAEVFVKSNNGKEDILDEYVNLTNEENFEKLLEKYNFTHLLVLDYEPFYYYLDDNDNYVLLYKGKNDSNSKYKIYVRKDLVVNE